MAACAAQHGDDDAAQAYAAKVLELRPEFSVADYVERRALKEAGDRDHLRDALAKSGLPA